MYKWTTIICTALFVGYAAYKYYQGYVLEAKLLTCELIIATLIFPLLISVLTFFQDFLEFKRVNAVFDSSPFNELAKIGLTKAYSNINSKWLDARPILSGRIDDYPFECEVEKGILRITAQTNLDLVQKEHMRKLKLLFGEKHVEYDWLGIALVYNSQRRKRITFNQLKTELNQFVRFLKTEKITSWENTAAAKSSCSRNVVRH